VQHAGDRETRFSFLKVPDRSRVTKAAPALWQTKDETQVLANRPIATQQLHAAM
jgi:hypothetical protein